MPDFSSLNILFSAPSKAVIGSILLDAAMRETHSSTINVTDSPIEDGSIISDHAFVQPVQFTIDGMISDSPVKIFGGIRTAVQEGKDPGGLIGKFIFPAGATRSASADRSLLALSIAKEPITVVTGLRRYENMVITSYVVNRDKSRGKAIWFTMSFKQIQIASSATTKIPGSKSKKKDQTKGKTDKGKQDPGVLTQEEKASFSPFLSALPPVGLGL